MSLRIVGADQNVFFFFFFSLEKQRKSKAFCVDQNARE
jgi:hypothetical protein